LRPAEKEGPLVPVSKMNFSLGSRVTEGVREVLFERSAHGRDANRSRH
jgi:hypothetical protein